VSAGIPEVYLQLGTRYLSFCLFSYGSNHSGRWAQRRGFVGHLSLRSYDNQINWSLVIARDVVFLNRGNLFGSSQLLVHQALFG